METYRYEYNSGRDCGHCHRTWDAAVRCGKRLIRAAKSGRTFGHPISSDLLKHEQPESAENCVGVIVDGVRRGG